MTDLTAKLRELLAKAKEDNDGHMSINLVQSNGAITNYLTTLMNDAPSLFDEIDRLTALVERLEKYKSTILEEHFEMAAYFSDENIPNEFAGVRRYEGRAQAVGELADILEDAISDADALAQNKEIIQGELGKEIVGGS